MKIGDYNIHSIQAGLFKLDGGAMFGVVPKPLWSKSNPADEQNRIEMCTRVLLLENGKRKILIDTGIGYKMSEKMNKIFAVDYADFTLERGLYNHRINPEDITDVILTHLHFDHTGGSVNLNENGELEPAYKNATYYVQKKQLEWAQNPTERDKASFLPENFQVLEDKKFLKTFEGETKFDDFITLLPVNGHTPFMQMVKISDEKETLLYAADLIPMASHVPLPYIMGYDLLPIITLEEKREYLKQAKEGNYTIFFEHDPYTECGKIDFDGKNYFLKEKFNI